MASGPAAAAADPYADTSNVGWSLWVVPDDAAATLLRGAIAELSSLGRRRCDDARDFPIFEPHVTVGFVPKTIALDRIVALCDRLGSSTAAPIVVRWAGAETGDIYYQTLFLRAVATSTLSAMNDAFQREFGMRYEYRPHLSLVYAHIHDRPDVAEARQALLQAVPPGVLGDTTLSALEVWDTSGAVEDWRRLHRMSLSRLTTPR
jgi:hypothetical protein